MDFTLPNGQVISGIPDGTPEDQIREKLIRAGLASEADFPSQREMLKEKLGALGNPDAMAELIGSMATGSMAEIVGGVAGIAQSLNPFADEGAGAEAVKNTRENLTYQPKIPEAQKTAKDIGEAIQPLAEKFSAAETTLGEKTLDVTGSPVLAAAAHSVPTAALEALGIGAGKGAAYVAKNYAPAVKQSVKEGAQKLLQYQTPERLAIAQKLIEGSNDPKIATYKLVNGKAKPDAIAQEAVKQGFDEGVIAPLKNASKTDKLKMLKMTNIMEKGVKDKLYATTNRPTDVVGQTLQERLKYVFSKNIEAGRSLDGVAKSLQGKNVDYTGPINNFINNLDGMGVKLKREGGGKIKAVFDGSDIEGLDGPQRVINRIVSRMSDTRPPDAYDLHRLKKYIDENVTYGGGGEGLKGKTENILKSLRRDVDSVLDKNFPKYDKVNTQYSDTIKAIDDLQDVAGSKIDLRGENADKSIGQMARGVMSNNKSRVRLYETIGNVEDIAKKYGASFDDNFLMQSLYADELDRVFKPVARTSFQGQIDQAIQRGAGMASKAGAMDAVVSAVGKGAEKLRGINEENAFKSIKELLKQGVNK